MAMTVTLTDHCCVLCGNAIEVTGLAFSEAPEGYMRSGMSSKLAENGLRLWREWSPGLSTMGLAGRNWQCDRHRHGSSGQRNTYRAVLETARRY